MIKNIAIVLLSILALEISVAIPWIMHDLYGNKPNPPLTIEPITDIEIASLNPDGRGSIVTFTQNGERKVGRLYVDEWPK